MVKKIILLFLLLSIGKVKAQNKFSYFIYGMPLFTHLTNLNIDGDGVVGKLGVEAGIGTLYQLGNGQYWRFSIGYAERGARKRRLFDPNSDALNIENIDFHLRLRYITIPILYGFPSYGLNVQTGVSTNLLMEESQITSDNLPPQNLDFKGVDFMAHFNLEFEVTKQMFFNVNLFHSINTINRNDANVGWWFQRGSMHRGLGVGLTYYFSEPPFQMEEKEEQKKEYNF